MVNFQSKLSIDILNWKKDSVQGVWNLWCPTKVGFFAWEAL